MSAPTIRDQHAVVLGAGIAGLLATRVLADRFRQVTLIDGDALPETPGTRAGAPQGHHAHGLFLEGVRVLELLLPGITAELVEHGAVPIDIGADYVWGTRFGWGRRFRSGEHVLAASRGLFEWSIRRRVVTLPAVTLLERHRVQSLLGRQDRVTGVVLAPLPAGDPIVLDADLVVDATGRSTRVDHWLTELGCGLPPTSIVNARLGYATRVYRMPDNPPPWLVCYLMMIAPTTRCGIISPIEHGRWIVTLGGVGEDRPGRDEAGFLPFARSLPGSAIADALEKADPLTPVTVTHSSANRRRHLERLNLKPANLLLAGDSACCFNPIYAQGMTTAILAARILAACLDNDPAPERLSRDYHRTLAQLHDTCWMLATTADRRFASTDLAPTPVQRLLSRHLDRVITAGTQDADVQAAFLAVVNMTRPPRSLLAPRLLTRLATARPSGAGPRLAPPPRPPPAAPSHRPVPSPNL